MDGGDFIFSRKLSVVIKRIDEKIEDIKQYGFKQDNVHYVNSELEGLQVILNLVSDKGLIYKSVFFQLNNKIKNFRAYMREELKKL